MMTKEKTGDILMMRPYPGKEKILHKGILLIANHTHDEVVTCEGPLPQAGCADPSGYHLVSLAKRFRQVQDKEILMASFRWNFPGHMTEEDIALFRECMHRCMALMIVMHLPYDHTALESHARNWIRAQIKKLIKVDIPMLSKHEEGKVFCTESVLLLFQANRIDFWQYIPHQPLIAPCHIERLYESGRLKLVQDYGLARYLQRSSSSA